MPIKGYVGPRIAPGEVDSVWGVASSCHPEPSSPERYRPFNTELPVRLKPSGRCGVSSSVSPSARPASETRAQRVASVPGAVPYARLMRPIGSSEASALVSFDVDGMYLKVPALPPDVERYSPLPGATTVPFGNGFFPNA